MSSCRLIIKHILKIYGFRRHYNSRDENEMYGEKLHYSRCPCIIIACYFREANNGTIARRQCGYENDRKKEIADGGEMSSGTGLKID